MCACFCVTCYGRWVLIELIVAEKLRSFFAFLHYRFAFTRGRSELVCFCIWMPGGYFFWMLLCSFWDLNLIIFGCGIPSRNVLLRVYDLASFGKWWFFEWSAVLLWSWVFAIELCGFLGSSGKRGSWALSIFAPSFMLFLISLAEKNCIALQMNDLQLTPFWATASS